MIMLARQLEEAIKQRDALQRRLDDLLPRVIHVVERFDGSEHEVEDVAWALTGDAAFRAMQTDWATRPESKESMLVLRHDCPLPGGDCIYHIDGVYKKGGYHIRPETISE